VKLLIYVTYAGGGGKVAIGRGFRVLRGRSTVYVSTHRSETTFGQSRQWSATYWVYFRPARAGTYTYSGTVFVGSRHQHKTVTFRVAAS
jgi:hypothetical protein